MGFAQVAGSYYPDIFWDGQSDIHVSICSQNTIPFSRSQWKEVMACFAKAKYGQSLFRALNRKFDNTEWLVSGEEFSSIFMTDLYRHLNNIGDSISETKLKNPSTGNVFHRIAIRDNLVGGIRFWVEDAHSGVGLGNDLRLSWRFRIQALVSNKEEEEVRIRSRDIVAEAESMLEMVLDSFMEINEPTKTDMQSIMMMEHELELL